MLYQLQKDINTHNCLDPKVLQNNFFCLERQLGKDHCGIIYRQFVHFYELYKTNVLGLNLMLLYEQPSSI